MQRFLAIYVNQHGQPAATMLTANQPAQLPFVDDEFELGLPEYDGEPVTLIEMPEGEFVPDVVDVETGTELPMNFVNLPE